MPSVVIRNKGVTTRMSLTPMGTLNEALATYCAQKNLNPSDWTLKHRKHGVPSMTTPFRLCKLENNATLDLVPASSGGASSRKPIRVAVQTPERKRVQGAFPPTHTLWQILVEIDASNNTNILGRAAENGNYMMPTVTLVSSRRLFTGIQALTWTSLRSLGIQGSTLLRVTLKETTDVTVAQAKDVTVAEAKALAASKGGTSSKPSESKDPTKEPEPKKPRFAGKASPKPEHVPRTAVKPTPAVQSDNSGVKPVLLVSTLNTAIAGLKSEAGGQLSTALQTLKFVLQKLLKSEEEKFRTLRIGTGKLHARLGKFASARKVLQSVGFTDSSGDGSMVLLSDAEDKDFIKMAVRIISEEIIIATPAPVEESESSKPSLEPESEVLDFEWAKKQDEARRKEEEAKKQAMKEKKARDLLERQPVIEPLDFDWEKEKDKEEEEPKARMDVVNPEYNLADVRTALTRLRTDCGGGAKACLDAMRLLRAITKKLQEKPKKAQYRKLKLSAKAIATKIASRTGAMDYLAFLGFEQGKDKGFLVLPEEKEMDIKTSRALSILTRVYKEVEPEVPLFNDSQRALKIYDAEAVDERSFALLPQAKVLTDAQLVAASMRETKLRKALEGKSLEKEQFKRRYEKTIVRILVRSESVILQGYFSPNERILQLFQMVSSVVDAKTLEGGFALRLPPSRDIKLDIDGLKTIEELKLVPSAMLHLLGTSETKHTGLKAEMREKKQALVAEALPKAVNEDDIQRKIDELLGIKKKPKGNSLLAAAAKKKKKSTKKVPRWMQLQQEHGLGET
uniref:UBX domain-containing protein n=1 Tax=Lotharella globosa TaxID=91324 RepID=A0A7S3YU51_9EUKA|mmetsp:Transcript_4828/g.9442  ORF Transcript_4828/g.9442 Transcript_4828/m.9442 type:complete len:793 (+) Transcript_4828:85-2463(+)